jgi:hypothetical protein
MPALFFFLPVVQYFFVYLFLLHFLPLPEPRAMSVVRLLLPILYVICSNLPQVPCWVLQGQQQLPVQPAVHRSGCAILYQWRGLLELPPRMQLL